MCKRYFVGTYLKVNALHDNAQPCVFLLLLLSAIFSNENVVVFL